MSELAKDDAYKGCLYCESITRNVLGGRPACIFHQTYKNSSNAFEFWSNIRLKKPKIFDGFVFPEFQSFRFNEDKKTLSEDANFWLANEIPIFEHPLIFTNCTFQNIVFSKTTFKNEIRFTNCRIKNILFYHCQFADEHPIIFEKNQIQTSSFDTCKLSNENQKYALEFSFNKIDEIIINGCTFSSRLSIKNHKVSNENDEKLNIKISSESLISMLTLENCEINDFLVTKNFIQHLEINKSNIDKFYFMLNKNNTLIINENEFKKFLIKSETDFVSLFETSIEKEFMYENLKVEGGNLVIRDFVIGKECVFTIEHSNFLELILNNFYRFSEQILFSDICIHNLFEIKNSNLSKVQFNSMKIDLNCTMQIFQSNLSDSIFNSVEWGNINSINADRDIFRQLKNANDKQSNFLIAHKFYSKEMEEYSKNIHKKDIEEKIVFFLGKYISNFSQSWLMPLSWIIIVGIIFYLITFATVQSFFITTTLALVTLIIFFPEQKWIHYNFSSYLYAVASLFMILFSIVSLNSSITLDLFASFINPFGTFLKDGSSHHFIWLLHKLISSFLIYHFVVSLRRSTQR